jgi:hypothetical protein
MKSADAIMSHARDVVSARAKFVVQRGEKYFLQAGSTLAGGATADLLSNAAKNLLADAAVLASGIELMASNADAVNDLASKAEINAVAAAMDQHITVAMNKTKDKLAGGAKIWLSAGFGDALDKGPQVVERYVTAAHLNSKENVAPFYKDPQLASLVTLSGWQNLSSREDFRAAAQMGNASGYLADKFHLDKGVRDQVGER